MFPPTPPQFSPDPPHLPTHPTLCSSLSFRKHTKQQEKQKEKNKQQETHQNHETKIKSKTKKKNKSQNETKIPQNAFEFVHIGQLLQQPLRTVYAVKWD